MAQRSPPTETTRFDLWRPLLCGLLILAGLTAAALLILNAGGCAIAPMPDGDGYVVGMATSGKGVDPAQLAGLAGLVSGNPLIAAGIAAAVGVIGHQSGRNRGWDESRDDELKRKGIVATKEGA